MTKKVVVFREEEQEIIEVDQTEVKKALKQLLTKENDYLAMLYKKWDEYNEEFFFGQLSYPLITIDKLNNRTLGNYTAGKDALEIENHIRFNRNFISLNSEERVLETLRHEMIHQWQDETLYVKPKEVPRTVEFYAIEDGKRIKKQIEQKKRPKEWHNKDFKDMAQVVGIPAIGDKCYGNPAKMPEPKSYNRKYQCSCIASNGHSLTIWSTREIKAICTVCESPFKEVKKGGKVIAVSQSHIEKPGEDAVKNIMSEKYHYFKKFTLKGEMEDFIGEASAHLDAPFTEMESGVYQKNHNAYREGFRYWLAYNTAEVNPDIVDQEEADEIGKEKVAEKKKAPKTKKPAPKKKATPAEDPAEAPGKEVGKKKMDKKVVQLKVPKIAKPEPKERSHTNPHDILELYKEHGTIKAVAEKLGKTPGTIIYQAKKFNIDFKEGVIGNETGE